jgi:putative copper export protein
MLALVVAVEVRVLDGNQLRALLVPLARSFVWGAAGAWPVLLLSGYLLASRRLSSFDALSTTAYGRRLALKLVLIVLTLSATLMHVVLGRSRSRRALVVSRAMARVAFLLTAPSSSRLRGWFQGD